MNRNAWWMLVLAGMLAWGGRADGAPTPARAAELRQRFEEGCRLAAEDRLEPALEVFAEILREDGEARGSLLMSGLLENRRFRFAEAAGHLEQFVRLEPDHEQGLMGMVKALHGCGRAGDAEPFRLRLHRLRQTGKSAKLAVMASYEREVIPLPGKGWVSVQEYFDEGELKPRWSWLQMKDERTIQRRLQWVRLPESEAQLLRAGNPGLAPGPVFALSEPLYEGGEFRRTKIHQLLSGSAGYVELRQRVLALLAQ